MPASPKGNCPGSDGMISEIRHEFERNAMAHGKPGEGHVVVALIADG